MLPPRSGWSEMAAHLHWEQEEAGSIPAALTIYIAVVVREIMRMLRG